MLLGVETDKERRHVDGLLTNTDVSLGDKNTGVVNGLGEAKLEDLSLESSLQKVLNTEGKNVIELLLVLAQNTSTYKTSDKSISLEKTLGVLLVSGQKITGRTTDLGKLICNSVDFSLVLESVLSAELELRVKTSTVVGTLGDGVRLGVSSRRGNHGREGAYSTACVGRVT